jgi:hypothetical protein
MALYNAIFAGPYPASLHASSKYPADHKLYTGINVWVILGVGVKVGVWVILGVVVGVTEGVGVMKEHIPINTTFKGAPQSWADKS